MSSVPMSFSGLRSPVATRSGADDRATTCDLASLRERFDARSFADERERTVAQGGVMRERPVRAIFSLAWIAQLFRRAPWRGIPLDPDFAPPALLRDVGLLDGRGSRPRA
ncbi:hypothetical protein [Terrarubrum flagellatum]|uniref:hypothetical protein n=1 Tax=Terrirubrum flagellatum TaxID=2895980 RepID=UPI0031456064